jgi:hypothetical protein
MIKKIGEFINNLVRSLDNTQNSGYSARKLSALVGVLVAVYTTIKLIPKEYLIEALYAWLAFALLCLGIVTVEQIIKFKGGGNNDSTPK